MPVRDLTRPAPGRRSAEWLTDRVVRPTAARRSWLQENVVVLTLLALGALLALALTGLAAEVYESVEDGEGLAGLDQPALDAAQDLRTPTFSDAVTWFTDLGGELWFPVIAAALVIVMCAAWRSWEPLLILGIGLSVALAMTYVGKSVVGRVRPPRSEAVPPYESTASFPSGHAILATVLVSLVAYLVVRRVERGWLRALVVAVCALWALAMGLSRVYLGHHWLTDVCAGWALGLAWAAALMTLHQAWLLAREDDEEAAALGNATDGVRQGT